MVMNPQFRQVTLGLLFSLFSCFLCFQFHLHFFLCSVAIICFVVWPLQSFRHSSQIIWRLDWGKYLMIILLIFRMTIVFVNMFVPTGVITPSACSGHNFFTNFHFSRVILLSMLLHFISSSRHVTTNITLETYRSGLLCFICFCCFMCIPAPFTKSTCSEIPAFFVRWMMFLPVAHQLHDVVDF